MSFNKTFCFSVFYASLLLSSNSFSQGIHASITKSDKAEWSINYTASQAIKRIAFARNPDDSRTTRWQPNDDDFEVIFDNCEEFIVRKDGKEFSDFTLTLTPSY